MKLQVIMEYNDEGYLFYFKKYTGAYVRGKTKEEAFSKISQELDSYLKWSGMDENILLDSIEPQVIQEKKSSLKIDDADSDIIFESEKTPLSYSEYSELEKLVLRSAYDFSNMYESIPDKDQTVLKTRKTFYGEVPVTAREMYEHTNNVTSYYAKEIGIDFINDPDIFKNRLNVLQEIEKKEDFLLNKVLLGSYDEFWSVHKALRRFIWHDRIHAKAMYRMALKTFKKDIYNPFFFI